VVFRPRRGCDARHFRCAVLGTALLLAATAGPACAQWRLFESEFDRQTKPWSEIEARLPGYPRADNLIPFEAGGATPHRFYIDAPSLSVGDDGVVRYTLVVKTAGGATNVFFEGIRCETREQKLYAVGHREDGKWVRAREPEWRHIEYKEWNRQHGVLYADFFCLDRRRPRNLKQIIEALERESAALR
jgi:hypothetical protein